MSGKVVKLQTDLDRRPVYADDGGRMSKDSTARIVDRKDFKE